MSTPGDAFSALCEEYAAFQAREHLKLGSADEHLCDEALTPAQQSWLRDFSDRWSELCQ